MDKKQKPLSFVRKKLKPFRANETEHQFCFNEAWSAKLTQLVSLNENLEIGTEVENLADPASKPWYLFHLVVGRSRKHRHIITDGKKYYDVHGRSVAAVRHHAAQCAPWNVVESSYKPLNQYAKIVIEACIESFWKTQNA